MIIRELEKMYAFLPDQASDNGTRFKMAGILFAFVYSEKQKAITYIFQVDFSTYRNGTYNTLVLNNALRDHSNEYTPYLKANGNNIQKSDWGFKTDNVGVYARSNNPNSAANEKIYFGTEVSDCKTIIDLINNDTVICEEVEI